MSEVPLLTLLASTLGFVTGSFFLKRFADLGDHLDLGIAFTIFALSNLIYAQVLARGLGQGVVLSSMSQIVVMSGVGVVFFGEKLSLAQMAGLFLAVVSVWLFSSRPVAAATALAA